MRLPLFKNLHGTVIKAVRNLGGDAPVKNVEEEVANLLNLSIEDRTSIHRGNQTKLSNRVAWSRYYLKMKGLLESTKRGYCVLSERGKVIDLDDLKN